MKTRLSALTVLVGLMNLLSVQVTLYQRYWLKMFTYDNPFYARWNPTL